MTPWVANIRLTTWQKSFPFLQLWREVGACEAGCDEGDCCEAASTTTVTSATTPSSKPLEKDCSEVCKDSTDPEFVPDSSCSNHYCRCQIGLGVDGYCAEGEGWCSKEETCKVECQAEECYEPTTTTTTVTTSTTTTTRVPRPLEKDCSEVCKDSTDPDFVPDSCCSNHFCRCQIGLGVDGYCAEGEGWCCKEGGCRAGCEQGGCCNQANTTNADDPCTRFCAGKPAAYFAQQCCQATDICL